jgi:hypothetical protein
VSPVRYELGFYIPQDDILHSHRPENGKQSSEVIVPTSVPGRARIVIKSSDPWSRYRLTGPSLVNCLSEQRNSAAFVRKRNMPTDKPQLVGDFTTNFC